MTKTIFLILLGFLATNVEANVQRWDLSADVGFRSYPLGAGAGISAGWNQQLGGANPDQSPMYSYWRIGARYQSSIKVNTVEANLGFYPLSFVGVELARSYGHRNLDEIATLNCDVLKCDGVLHRTRIRVPLILGVDRFFLRARASYAWIEPDSSTERYAEESVNLALARGGDQLFSYDLMFGVNWRDDLRTLFFYDAHNLQDSGAFNRNRGLIIQKIWGAQTLSLGSALYTSSTSSLHGQVFVGYVYEFKKGLGF